MRRTKIVATLGPSTDSPTALRRVLAAGVDVVRLNFSHGKAEDHVGRAAAVREHGAALGRDIGILCDLQGPKIRIESFRGGPIELVEAQEFSLDTAMPRDAGNQHAVGCAIDFHSVIKPR